jgi:hypothetical protein
MTVVATQYLAHPRIFAILELDIAERHLNGLFYLRYIVGILDELARYA